MHAHLYPARRYTVDGDICLHGSGIKGIGFHIQLFFFYMGLGELNFGPHACPLLTELSLHLQILLFILIDYILCA